MIIWLSTKVVEDKVFIKSYRSPFQPTYFVSTYSVLFVTEVTGDLYLRGEIFNRLMSYLLSSTIYSLDEANQPRDCFATLVTG